LRFGQSIDSTPAANDALDVLGGPGPAHCEQSLFGVRRRDASQRPNFRVRELAARERLGQPRQRSERARYPNTLTGGAAVEPDSPRQPLGARAEAGVPAGARVELADELEQPRGRRVEVRRELGDLVAEPLELGGATNGGFGHRRDADVDIGIHRRESSIALRRLYPPIFAPPRRLHDQRSHQNRRIFGMGLFTASRTVVRASGSRFRWRWPPPHAQLRQSRQCPILDTASAPNGKCGPNGKRS